MRFIERNLNKNGESILDNQLPFWAAAIIDRYLLFVVPVALLVLPILGRSPALYAVYMRNKVNRWYNFVRAVELRVPTLEKDEIAREIERLDELDDELARKLTVSSEYMPAVYHLRTHVDYVISKLKRRQDQLADAKPDNETTNPPVEPVSAGK